MSVGADPLLNLLYETEITPKSALVLQEIPKVWSYRTPVTLHHLRQRFDAEVGHDVESLKKCPVLQLFLKEVSISNMPLKFNYNCFLQILIKYRYILYCFHSFNKSHFHHNYKVVKHQYSVLNFRSFI